MAKANALANGDDDYIWKEFYLGHYNNSSQTGSAINLDSNALHFTYEQLRAVTLAHETPGAALYQNEDLKNDILDTVEFLHVNHNNENVTNYGNWFTWEIGMPISLSEIVILISPGLISPGLIPRGLCREKKLPKSRNDIMGRKAKGW